MLTAGKCHQVPLISPDRSCPYGWAQFRQLKYGEASKSVSREPTQSEGQRAGPAQPLGSRQRSCMLSTPLNALLNLSHREWAQDTGLSSQESALLGDPSSGGVGLLQHMFW